MFHPILGLNTNINDLQNNLEGEDYEALVKIAKNINRRHRIWSDGAAPTILNLLFAMDYMACKSPPHPNVIRMILHMDQPLYEKIDTCVDFPALAELARWMWEFREIYDENPFDEHVEVYLPVFPRDWSAEGKKKKKKKISHQEKENLPKQLSHEESEKRRNELDPDDI